MSNEKQSILNRQVFDKNAFKETINTEFTQLVNPPDPSFFSLDLATIGDFFQLYEKFFYENMNRKDLFRFIPLAWEYSSEDYLGI